MDNFKEVLLTTDGSGQLWNGCIWDHATGSSLRLLKGGTAASKTTSLIASDYVISADIGKPLLTCWTLSTKENQQIKIVCPGRVTALTVTPNGAFCICAIAEKLYVWQVCTGDLLNVIAHHYQTVTCLRMSDDGGFLVSAGEDCLVLVWKLARILRRTMGSSMNDNHSDAPHYTWANHSLAVTSVHVGKGGRRTRVVTASLDHTCRLYSLANGNLLLTVIFEVSIHAVSMDATEAYIFAGGMNGNIFQVNLFDMPQTLEHQFQDGDDGKFVFIGHSAQVLSLTVSMDALTLVSGSNDFSAKVWNISSRQCLRSLIHKGPVTNVLLFPEVYFTKSANKPTKNIQPFRSYVSGSDNSEVTWLHTACITPLQRTSNGEDLFPLCQRMYHEDEKDNYELQLEIEGLKKLNGELFSRSAKDALT